MNNSLQFPEQIQQSFAFLFALSCSATVAHLIQFTPITEKFGTLIEFSMIYFTELFFFYTKLPISSMIRINHIYPAYANSFAFITTYIIYSFAIFSFETELSAIYTKINVFPLNYIIPNISLAIFFAGFEIFYYIFERLILEIAILYYFMSHKCHRKSSIPDIEITLSIVKLETDDDNPPNIISNYGIQCRVQYIRDTVSIYWRIFPINVFAKLSSLRETFGIINSWINESCETLRIKYEEDNYFQYVLTSRRLFSSYGVPCEISKKHVEVFFNSKQITDNMSDYSEIDSEDFTDSDTE